MSIGSLDEVKRALLALSENELGELLRWLRQEYPIHPLEREWGVTAEVVLATLSLSGDFTQRMFKGVLAEGARKVNVIDKLQGWENVPVKDRPYDFKILKDGNEVTIQAKLQRSEGGKPWMADRASGLVDPQQFVAEIQKSRKGNKKGSGEATRPIRFGEWDILAISIWPATKDWSRFMFTVGCWLVPRLDDPTAVAIYQPVSPVPNEDWTDQLETAIDWLSSGVKKTIKGAGTKQRRGRKAKAPAPLFDPASLEP